MYKHTQRSFAGGVLDRELMGRQDLQKYFTGASKIQNLLVRRQGNLAKRRGTDFCADLTGILGRSGGEVRPLGAHRLIPIVRERDKGLYALLADRRAFLLDTARGILCSDGRWRRSAPAYDAPADGEATVAATDFSLIVQFVARIGSTTYESLDAAISAAAPGDTIVIGENATLSAAKTFKGILDLNGHTLTVAANVTLTFQPGAGIACGIVSSAQGGTLAWSVTGTHSANGITHASGIFEMRDVTAAYPGTGHLLHSSAASTADHMELTRCTLSTSTGTSICNLNNNVTGQTETIVAHADDLGCYGYSWFSAGCLIRGCAITYSTTATATTTAANPCPLKTGALNVNARKFSFVSGTLSSNGGERIAANIGLFVYGGRLRCSGIGVTRNASYAAALSRMVRGLCSASLGEYVHGGTEEAADTETVDGVAYYSYAPTGTTYAEADNTWIAATWADGGASSDYESTARSLTTGNAPYCVATPYADLELDDLDCFQSGDTVFIAHSRHAPARLSVAADGTALSFGRLSFNASAWRRPRIVRHTESVHPEGSSLSYSGSTKTETKTSVSGTAKSTTVYVNDVQKASTDTTLVSRTVRYCATYVKDGQESPPSAPVTVTYGAPWEEGGKITLTLSRGANAEEPDWYNVYKSESTGWGLIGSTAKPAAVRAEPQAIFGYATATSVALTAGSVPSAFLDGEAVASTESADVTGEMPSSAAKGLHVKTADGLRLRLGAGGLRFGTAPETHEPAACVLEFGLDSGVRMDTLVLCMDSHAMSYGRGDGGTLSLSDRRILSGKTVTVTVTYQPTGGDSSATLTTTPLSVTLPEAAADDGEPTWTGESTLSLGEPEAGSEAAVASLAAASGLRKATFSFPDLAANKNRQVVRIEISCKDENDVACECVLCGISMSLAASAANTFDDNYITPDMSISPPSADDAFARSGDFPSCVGVYQQRLVFAASESRPFAFWMSAVGDLYTFAPHDSIREDDALEAELAATEFPRINHLVSSRDLVMLCDGGEWKIAPVSGNTLTYKTLSATLQSSIGSAKWLKPLAVGNEVVFAERTGMTLRSILYNYASDGYETTDLTVLAGNIFADNPVRRMCYKQHPDSTIVCVLRDGTVAAMVYMPEHEVAAWTRHILGGGALAVECATNKAINGTTSDVAMTVRLDGRTELWAVRPDLPEMTVRAQACMDGCRVLTGTDAASAWLDGWTAIDLLTAATYASKAALEAADGHGSRSYLCGFPFAAELATVRPEPPAQGTIQFEIKNAKDVEVRVLDGGSWRAAPFGFVDHATYAQRVDFRPTAVGGALALDSSDHTLLLSGENTGDGRVQIASDDPWPLSILSLSANYEIQPLSNQEG